jgi:hypothetical protein
MIRRRLLAQESPAHPSAEALAHLDTCPACRAWHRRLLAVERQLPLLPVPPSTGKDRVLRAVLTHAPTEPPRTEAPIATLRPTAWQSTLKERARQKLALAFALAATLLVFALGILVLPRAKDDPVNPRDAYRAKLERERDELLAVHHTPSERVRSLAAMAKRLWLEARMLADSDLERLGSLARFYGDLVEKDLLTQAGKVPLEERRIVLRAVQEQMQEAESDLGNRANDDQTRAGAVAHLKAIARSSRAGYERIGALLSEVA